MKCGSTSGGGSGSSKSCGNCGMTNYREGQCWELPKNSHNRPDDWTPKFNITGAAVHPPSNNNDIIEDDNVNNASKTVCDNRYDLSRPVPT